MELALEPAPALMLAQDWAQGWALELALALATEL